VLEGQWGATEIIPNLYVGDLQDAQKFVGMIISVLPDWLEAEPAHAVWMPFLKNGLATLDSTAALIDHALQLDLRRGASPLARHLQSVTRAARLASSRRRWPASVRGRLPGAPVRDKREVSRAWPFANR
jgi:hypothetical protein